MYGVISSKTRKITQPYGVLSSTTRKISKIYSVIGGVTRLIYTSKAEPGERVIVSSSTFVVPSGVTSIDIFCVGGGGGGGGSYEWYKTFGSSTYYLWDRDGAAGAGGYTYTALAVSVTPGEVLTITIGAGGTVGSNYAKYDYSGDYEYEGSGLTNGGDGGVSSVINSSGTVLCSANGGGGGRQAKQTTTGSVKYGYQSGANGGSGSGAGGSSVYVYDTSNAWNDVYYRIYRGSDGSNGSNGGSITYEDYSGGADDPIASGTQTSGGTGGSGQGSTTRAYGVDSSENTLYSTAGRSSSNISANTGDGGYLCSGASGAVLIRW